MNQSLRTIILSAVTSLVISSMVLIAGAQILPRRTAGIEPAGNLTDLEQAVRAESPIIDVVSRTEPAVASVIISKDLPVLERVYEEIPGPFGIRIPRVRQNGTQLREIGGGTAFFITADGLMLTNKHVVDDEDAQYSVLLNDGRTLEATVVARDSLTDIALLKVQGSNFPFLHISADEEPALGQSVIAIGNALGEFRNTVSIGVVSGLQRSIIAGNPAQGTAEQLSRIIQTDAAINEGNSGGPLLNLRGEVIGMNTAVASMAQNIGFAIPADDLTRVAESFRQYGRIVRPYLGVRYVAVTDVIARERSLKHDYGMLIISGEEGEPSVIPGSPAAKAGLLDGDVILSIDGEELNGKLPLADIVQRKKPGDVLTLRIERAGAEQNIKVTVEEWTDPES
jgi:serine protease Do